MEQKEQMIFPSNDPWEPYTDIKQFGEARLTNIEITTTHLCNMRCEHCAVGYSLLKKDPDAFSAERIIQSLDDVEHLRTFSITGGEPMMSVKSIQNHVLPLLQYAKSRGAKTQINSNLTMPFERYEWILPYLDVLHISHNYGSADDFAEIGFAVMDKKPSAEKRKALFQTMVENSRRLAAKGMMISAETMINSRTLPHLESIHDQIVQMQAARHEVHPMYPTNFADHLPVASLDDIRSGIHRLLDHKDPDMWVLFGTLPFYPCNDDAADQALIERLFNEQNVTVRNDPDGQSRVNINIFSGDIHVTDFTAEGQLGNIETDSLEGAFRKWRDSKTAQALNCHCPAAECLGPNLLVKQAYYPDTDFTKRKAKVTKP
ncbi:radical SAM/CxCxxxxC motif protein YfkAB [Salisediminibacterium halotolerans]|uniref:Radical SAM/CxCxxxxC motif protein YfkAB n=1 Tax=Salisediminibacterium halotolerans TaxID=517425 RepID=A0A1H9UFF5_9BACI|nr:radical SAM/CxCxxxxC motif protein YfkAB [Salisediminibacterium haloalkalitolerans]SES08186.1 radical SAM/CxCxxxxC motif protein YfkAB [Salisediminibacterium haloalkalitolerans]